MTTEKRLADIERSLTPKQCVLAYLEDIMRRFGSHEEWLMARMDRPDQRRPEDVIRAAQAAARFAKSEQVKQDDESVALEVAFLLALFEDMARVYQEKAENYGLQASLCARGLQLLLLQDPIDERQAGGPALDDFLHRVLEVRDQILDFAARVYLHRGVVEAVRKNYFDGHPVLFPDFARRLEVTIDMAERIVDEYNSFTQGRLEQPQGDKGPQAEQPDTGGFSQDGDAIDLAVVLNTVKAQVRQEVGFAVNMAKGDAMAKVGRGRDGHDLAKAAFRRHFGPSGQ